MTFPGISVIIPAYNEEKRIASCIGSIKQQDYDGDIEILVVDDDSTDNTVKIVKELGSIILRNGSHNIERGKSIGLQHAKYDFVFLIDSDNILPDKDWLKSAMIALLENEKVAGVQASKFKYDLNHSISDRYCELFGINDPTVYYLKKQDKLGWTDEKWVLRGTLIKETESYFLVQYNPKDLVTVGSQGFLTKRSLLMKTNYKPYLFHIDSNLELVNQGYNRFIFLKNPVIHLHSNTIKSIIKKLNRNMRLFQEQAATRRFKYNVDFPTMLKLGLVMCTVIVPLSDSIRGFLKKRDIAWFLHPFLCIWVSMMYAALTVSNKLRYQRGCS
ncbi:MAG: glycosyltransferase [Candidatus Methanoperedens sp.]|nr:glycosyltransferase [Candidatus Methanoperedens sp.]